MRHQASVIVLVGLRCSSRWEGGKKSTPVFSCTAVPEWARTVSNLKQVGNEET